MPRPSPRSILLVARGLDRFGTGAQAILAAEALRDAGWSVGAALTSGGGSVAGALTASGAEVARLSCRPAPGWGAVMPLVRRLRSAPPEIVVACGRRQTRLAAAALTAAPGPRLVALVARAPRGTGDRIALSRAARVVASAEPVAAACAAAGVAPGGIETVVPGGVAAPRRLDRPELAARLGLDPATRWTVCVAPLEPSAHLARLVWAIDQLGVVHRGLEHVLVGAGPLSRRLARRAWAQRIADRFRVVPWCAAAGDLLAEAALVWQSGEVAYGGALIDGLAHGRPLVAVESVAARQAIADGVVGRLVAADPESEFPRRAFQILEDPALAVRYGAAAKERAARVFDPAAAAAGYVAAVERAAG